MSKRYVQVFGIKFKHPETGNITVHKFLGPALLTPEEQKRNANISIEEYMLDTWLEEPYKFDPKQYDDSDDDSEDKPPE